MNALLYKGYMGRITLDLENNQLFGEIINSADTITFYGKTVKEAEKEFHKSVDVHLKMCKKHGLEPQRTYSGKLNVRLGTELHRAADMVARGADESLNSYIVSAVKRDLAKKGRVKG